MTKAPGPDPEDWIFDPALAALDRSIRREFRDEAAEVESAVEQSELRANTIADLAREARNRGDLVSVATARRAFNGNVTYAAGNLICVRTETFEADVDLDAVTYMRIVQPGRRGGQANPAGPGTFEMRLVELRTSGVRIELGWRDREETLLGRVTAVGQDHVTVLDEHRQPWVVPLSAVAYVMRRRRLR